MDPRENERILVTLQDLRDVAVQHDMHPKAAGHAFTGLHRLALRDPDEHLGVKDGQPAIDARLIGNIIARDQYLYRVGAAGRAVMGFAYEQFRREEQTPSD